MRLLALPPGLVLAACATAAAPAPAAHVEVGLAFDRGGEISSFADGIADPQTRRRVTIDDPVRVASISKMVTAIGVMRLVEQGKLDLGSDVSRWLGWPLRNPNFPRQPITLSLLLSHTGSVREHDDDYAIPLGGSLQAAMRDPGNWDARHGPADAYFKYANLNFPIIGSIVERVTGERFDLWMRRNVLEPLKIDACYNWPTCSDAAVVRAVEFDGPDGAPLKDDLHGRRPACPVCSAGCALRPRAVETRRERRAVRTPRRPQDFRPRPRPHWSHAAQPRHPRRHPHPLAAMVDTLLAQVWRSMAATARPMVDFTAAPATERTDFPTQLPVAAMIWARAARSWSGMPGMRSGSRAGYGSTARGGGDRLFRHRSRRSGPKCPDSAYSAAEVEAFRRTYALLPM